ncbi:MAG TPA: hypothetical protein PKY82_21900 [Pyrinomonadaceae bacterium]|nr:hypothetical protein [Pyrinomonadaceae bacterium]
MKWFDIPTKLVPKLRELQTKDLRDKEVESEDVVLMFGGLGDPMYLTFDGRVIILDWMDESPPREAKTLKEATIAIVIGAKIRNCPELLNLLPLRPPDSINCAKCEKGWIKCTDNFTIICHDCGGLGWIAK